MKTPDPIHGCGSIGCAVILFSIIVAVILSACGCTTTGNGAQKIKSGYSETAAPYTKLKGGWERGQGPVKVLVATRGTDNGTEGAIMFREATFDADGKLLSISGESDYAPIITAQ